MDTNELNLIPSKKPRKEKRVLTFQERIKVILEYQDCPSARILSEKYGCGKTQILNILRNKKEYLEQWANSKPQNTRKTTHLIVSLGIILNEWIERAKAYNSYISDDTIRQTGREIAKVLDIPNFYPTTRWLERFKRKYFITNESFGFYLQRKSLRLADIMVDLKNVLVPDALKTSHTESKDMAMAGKLWNNILPSRAIKSSSPKQFNDFQLPIIASVTYANDSGDSGDDTDSDNKNVKIENEIVEIASDSDDENFKNSDHSSSRSRDMHRQSNNNNMNDESHFNEGTEREQNEELSTYPQALQLLKLLEDFALRIEDTRAIGLLNQLENYYKEKITQMNL